MNSGEHPGPLARRMGGATLRVCEQDSGRPASEFAELQSGAWSAPSRGTRCVRVSGVWRGHAVCTALLAIAREVRGVVWTASIARVQRRDVRYSAEHPGGEGHEEERRMGMKRVQRGTRTDR